MLINLLRKNHLFLSVLTDPINTPSIDSESNEGALDYDSSIDIRYKLFWSLWAVATLFHMANDRIFTDEMHYVLLSFAAVFLILKPWSIIRLLFFLSLQLYESLKMMPYISNHWIFTTLVNLTILHALAYLVIKRRRFRINRVDFYKTFAPLVRAEVIILYFFVVLHKLNTSFFSPDISCATDFFVSQNPLSSLTLTNGVLLLNAYATVIIETLIPVLLCFRRTRNLGVLLGLSFHFIIAYNPLNGFYDFSSMLFAAYVLFTDNKFSGYIFKLYKKAQGLKALSKEQFYRFSILKLVTALVLFVFGVVVLHFLAKNFTDFFRHICWTTYGVVFIIVFSKAVFSKENSNTLSSSDSFKLKHYSLLLFPIIVFINGLCPYLGLKTENSFAMFSNLRTEGGVTNHLFIPVETQIFDFQKDVVEVISSSDENLQNLANSQKLMVYHNFKKYIASKKPDSVKYIRNGQEYTYTKANAALHSELTSLNPIHVKFLQFRSFNKYEPQPCSH
ncbi:hypothetical protein [Pontibacter harenae]|uniref:hypothetical protein n=1 Tax=Pontibacter harenae TaxID=2894083 RepID=UPI001E467B4A|nr:hypothetical protein [Pontibacter harenae]MCC9165620.1 hypothetical protein [Pontibacter harenae]